MVRSHEVRPAGEWVGAVDAVWVDFDRRHRRRILMTTEAGAELLLDLAHAVRLRDGDGLVLDDGRIVAVRARAEALAEFWAPDAAALVRIAWHLGNRHLPVQLLGDRLRVRHDHVIEDMVRQLGGHVTAVEAPFDPEAGAYAGGHSHAHDED